MMGVKVENLNVILLRGPVPDCIFHITAQEVLTDVHANMQRYGNNDRRIIMITGML